MDAERALVSKMIQSGELDLVVSRGIQEDHFADEECKEVYEYAIWHTREYGEPPSVTAVKNKFPDFELEVSSDAISYLLDQFIVKVKRRFANDSLLALAEMAEDPTKAEEIDIHFLDVS